MRLIFVLLLLASTSSQAADPSVAELAARVAALEARLARVEAGGAAAPAAIKVSAKAQDKSNWLKCKQGMTRDQVRTLLGDPTSEQVTSAVNGYSEAETWIYGTWGPGSDGGSVLFAQDKVVQCTMNFTRAK